MLNHPKTTLMKKTILIAEDNDFMSLLMHQLLKDEYNLVVKNNGADALEWLQEGNIPDIILTDLNMPRVDGWMLMSFIQASYNLKDVPVLVLSVFKNARERFKSMNLGATDYIEKPFVHEHLVNKVSMLLSPSN